MLVSNSEYCLNLYFNQPPSRTGVANRQVVFTSFDKPKTHRYFVCWYLLLGSTALPRVLITQTTCEGRFKALFLTTFLLMLLHLCSIVEGSLLHVARITRARLTASFCPTLSPRKVAWDLDLILCSHLLEGVLPFKIVSLVITLAH